MVFVLHFYRYLEVFLRVFLCDFIFQTLYILTLELSYLSYLLGSCFSEIIGLCLLIPPSIVTFLLFEFPLV